MVSMDFNLETMFPLFQRDQLYQNFSYNQQ